MPLCGLVLHVAMLWLRNTLGLRDHCTAVHAWVKVKISRLKKPWVLELLRLLLFHHKLKHFKLLFLHESEWGHLLLVHSFILVHQTLWMVTLIAWNYSCLLGLIDNNSRSLYRSYHRRPATPVVIFASGTSRANDFKRTILSIDTRPVVINAVLVTSANFPDGRSFIPIVVCTNGSVLADYFLVNTVSHLLHEVNVLFFRFLWAKRSHTVSESL